MDATEEALRNLTKRKLVERGAALDPSVELHMKMGKDEMVEKLLERLALPEGSSSETEKAGEEVKTEPLVTSETPQQEPISRVPEPEPLTPEELHVVFSQQMPCVARGVAEKVMPRLPDYARAVLSQADVFSVLLRLVGLCADHKRTSRTVHVQITRPNSQLGRNLRMHLRRCISMELGAEQDGGVRGALLAAITEAMEELVPRGCEHCTVEPYLEELELGAFGAPPTRDDLAEEDG